MQRASWAGQGGGGGKKAGRRGRGPAGAKGRDRLGLAQVPEVTQTGGLQDLGKERLKVEGENAFITSPVLCLYRILSKLSQEINKNEERKTAFSHASEWGSQVPRVTLMRCTKNFQTQV